MALIKHMIGQISGKLGGMIFGHGRSGPIVKAFRVPVNPNSQKQQEARTQVSHMSTEWSTMLTDDERDAWNTYAANVTLTNRLGDAIHLTGQNHFVRSNVIGQRNGLILLATAPTEFNVGELHQVSITETVAGTLVVAFDDTEDWVDEDNSILIVQQARPKAPTVEFFKGPFDQLGVIAGDAITPPTSPTDMTGGYKFASGQKIFARIRLLRADGRLSAPQIVSAIAAIA